MSDQPVYDIIFAGGPCSCIAASRLLGANSKLKILVCTIKIIEYGAHTRNVPHHIQPGRVLRMFDDPTVFHLHAGKPSQALRGRAPIVTSGKALGGGSSVNLMAYTRASASDYDDWETVHGNKGWGSESLIPLIQKAETYQERDVNGTHGSNGPIKVSFLSEVLPTAKDFLDTARQYDTTRESTEDVNGFYECNKYGACEWARYIDKETGRRSDVPHHYIYNRPENTNLTILTKSIVDSVIIEDGKAVGVKYHSLENPEGGFTSVRATKLVVLSAGAFGSPAILERSGIGSARVLEPLGIPQVVDLPGVGENYMDHILCCTGYRGDPDIKTMDELYFGDEDSENFKHHERIWSETGQGLMAHNGADVVIKLRPDAKDLQVMSPQLDEYWKNYFEPAPDKPLVLFYCLSFRVLVDRSIPIDLEEKFYGIWFFLTYPASTGYTHIVTKDATSTQKDFHPGFLDHEADVATARWIYKKSREHARRMNSYRGEDASCHPTFGAGSSATVLSYDTPRACDVPEIHYTMEDDKCIDEYMRKSVQTSWHSCGTCAMKPREKGGVVDERLNVYGVRGLKVADCSIFPGNVGANTYNTAIAIGEKAAVLIAEDLGLAL
ncbi:alcohol oxidase-like protein [Panaeolus papilionaceus]|nr:alcohol oxidase-like protein [Panaeolus papilionaceus]